MIRTLLVLAFLIAPTVAQAEWHEASTDHFVVYSDESPAKLELFAIQLERFDKALRALRGLKDERVGDANRVTVYVVPRSSTVGKLVGDTGIAGFYRPRAGGSMAVIPRRAGQDATDLTSQAILLHEYTHHLMLSLWPHAALPSWFIEGYAEFHATARFEKSGGVSFGLPPQYRGYGLLAGNALPADKLLTAEGFELAAEQRDGLYGRGWLLTHYLTFGERRPKQLSTYLLAINDGKPAMQAATEAFGDLKLLDRELERYKTGKFVGKTVLPAAFTVGPVKIRKLTPGEAATMDVRIVSKNGVNEKTAPGVYVQAKKAAAPFPDDPGAQIVLAETAYDAGDYGGAEGAADRAIAVDAKAIDAHVYKAMARMALAEKASDQSKETWSAIRKIISTANRLDPDDPEPLILFFRSFVEAGQIPTKNARIGLYRAFELGPQDRGLRMNAATTYLQDGNPAMARELLKPLAYDPHGGGLAKAAATLIAAIDAGKGTEGLRTLREKPADGEDAGADAKP
ncbi:tetratricopeptide repeat protein [Sphingomonas sp. LT1P40]|uniref:tetratricopeptide repeat protein n=1 Tax=Alteristakelama amylovorans TaxID=3096166 RepID=UPI002FC5A7B6